MKKIKTLGVLFAAALMVQCSSDSSSGPAPTLLAKWNLIKTVSAIGGAKTTDDYTDNEAGCDKDYIEFVSGGNFRNVVFNKDPQNNCLEDEDVAATWSQTSTALTISGGEFDDTYTVTKLSGSELRIAATSSVGGIQATVTYYFKKAAN